MLFSYIFLQCSFWDHLPTALALCLLPFILGWLAAYAYYKVGALRNSVNELTTSNADLNSRVTMLTGDLTDLRVKLTQAEADIESKNEQMRKLRTDLMLCESERNALREQAGNAGAKAKTAVAAPAPIMFMGTKFKWDDLKIVEGIGPKIADLLNNAGIKTWQQLSETSTDRLREILDAGGSQYNIHDPGTWPEQAGLAARSEWDALKKLQEELNAGKAE